MRGSRDLRALAFIALALAACEVNVWLGDALHDGVERGATTGMGERAPCLVVLPPALEFGVVRDGETASKAISLRNTCEAPLSVTGVVMSGSPGFRLELAGHKAMSSPQSASEGIPFSEGVVLTGGGELIAEVHFEPHNAQPAFGNLILRSDDPFGGFGLAIQMSANVQIPCLVTFPKNLDFGGVLLGQASERTLILRSCGEAPLVIDELSLEGEASTRFEPLDWSLGSYEFMASAESQSLTLRYEPDGIAETDEDGLPKVDSARLVVLSDSFGGATTIPLKGFGAAEPCPHALITPGNPSTLEAPESLVFEGGESYGVGSEVVAWEWGLDAPLGSDARLEPLGEGIALLTSGALGRHTVSLSVRDAKGMTSCTAASHVLDIVASSGLAIELWWSTEGDLDLHLLHELAVGIDIDGDAEFDGWFDKPFDAFWANPSPSWGQLGEGGGEDDPRLLHDDFDGHGPERIVLQAPEAGRTYRIGVHHWEDHDAGPASAWLRVYKDGVLVHEAENPNLAQDALWDVGVVSAEGVWLSESGAPAVTPALRKPWQGKGR